MRFKHSTMVIGLLLGAGLMGARGQIITNFAPQFASPGELVTIYGSDFYYSGVTIDRVLEVSIGNVLASFSIIANHQIIATIPSGAVSGLIGIHKSAPRPWVYSSQIFTVIGPGPYITGFTPSSGNVGTLVTIQGVHFTGATAVRFNGSNAPGFFVAADTQIQVNAPSTVTTGPITVVTPLGSYTSTGSFFVPPAITGFAPASGRPGTNVVLTGRNFTGVTAVYFNGLNAPFTVNSLTQINTTVPELASSGPVMVMAPAGAYPTSSNFVVLPSVSGFTPGFGAVGTNVTIFGANFNVGTPAVKFGGVPAAAPTGVTFNQLTAVVPSGATNALITVTTTDGSATSAQMFYLPPAVTSLAPTNSAPGTTVTLTGQNLLGATNVSFNNTPAAFTPPTNNTTIHAVVPSGFTTGPLVVNTPGGTATSGAKLFYAPPAISGFTPTHGLPGTNVVISGANFLGTTAVRFNGTNASFTPPTNNATLVATVPNGAQTGPITVVAPAGTTNSANAFTLDYTADLRVTATGVPAPVFVGSNLVYSVVVVNQGPFPVPLASLSDTLPESASLKSAGTTLGSLNTNGNPVIATLGTLNVGASATITLTVSPQTVGWITNLAVVAGGHPDPQPANNTFSTPTFVQPLPLLSIRRQATDRVRVSWPAALSNFTLQSKPGLEGALPWSNVLTTPNVVGDERVVTEPNSAPTRFYRLRH